MRADIRDFALREVGCIVCRDIGMGFVPCEKHHLLTTGKHGTGKRRGEKYTVGLCGYHHRNEYTGSGLADAFWKGPSYAGEPRAFRDRWPDSWLLETQNRLLREYADKTIGITYEQLGAV